jgi:hypothetical protein
MLSGKGAVPDSEILKDISDMGIAGLTLFTNEDLIEENLEEVELELEFDMN